MIDAVLHLYTIWISIEKVIFSPFLFLLRHSSGRQHNLSIMYRIAIFENPARTHLVIPVRMLLNSLFFTIFAVVCVFLVYFKRLSSNYYSNVFVYESWSNLAWVTANRLTLPTYRKCNNNSNQIQTCPVVFSSIFRTNELKKAHKLVYSNRLRFCATKKGENLQHC